MSPEPVGSAAFPPIRATALGLVWLAIFSLLYTVGVENSAWPMPRPGIFRDLDLYAGFAAGLGVLVSLVRPDRARRIG